MDTHGLAKQGSTTDGSHHRDRYICTASITQVPQAYKCRSSIRHSRTSDCQRGDGGTHWVSHFWGTLLQQKDTHIRPIGVGVVLQADTKNRSFALLATGGDYTGRYRLYTEAIESSECVRCRPAHSSTYIYQ